jgi:hypothetical protein
MKQLEHLRWTELSDRGGIGIRELAGLTKLKTLRLPRLDLSAAWPHIAHLKLKNIEGALLSKVLRIAREG